MNAPIAEEMSERFGKPYMPDHRLARWQRKSARSHFDIQSEHTVPAGRRYQHTDDRLLPFQDSKVAQGQEQREHRYTLSQSQLASLLPCAGGTHQEEEPLRERGSIPDRRVVRRVTGVLCGCEDCGQPYVVSRLSSTHILVTHPHLDLTQASKAGHRWKYRIPRKANCRLAESARRKKHGCKEPHYTTANTKRTLPDTSDRDCSSRAAVQTGPEACISMARMLERTWESYSPAGSRRCWTT